MTFLPRPWARAWEAAYNRTLLTPEERKSGLYTAFDLNDLLAGDLTARSAAYANLISSKVMNPNEARTRENLPTYPGGDAFTNPNTTPGGATIDKVVDDAHAGTANSGPQAQSRRRSKTFFGDAERDFTLTPTLIEELERVTGAGIGALAKRLFTGHSSTRTCCKPSASRLIGGGETPQVAASLGSVYGAERPINEVLPVRRRRPRNGVLRQSSASKRVLTPSRRLSIAQARLRIASSARSKSARNKPASVCARKWAHPSRP